MGRTFQESFQKALRGLETGIDGLTERSSDREEIVEEIGNAGPERILFVGDAFRIGMSLDEIFEETAIDPWFLAQIEEIVTTEQPLRGRNARVLSAAELRFVKQKGFSDQRLAHADGQQPARAARGAPRAGRAAGLQARRHLRRRVRDADRLHVLDLRGRRRVRGRADRPQEDHGARRRPEPHRPGHRVRLLLRPRRARDARGRLRDHHGQLQPGDGVDRLRHLRPPVLRAGDARRRARDRRRREAASA